jgi:integrator complex subunit 11
MADTIQILPLGAGQDVGRSCIIVRLGGKTIMFDCGMHMGFSDERRFPDFTHLAPTGPYSQHVDLVILSHFHLDHSGALPYFTERAGYTGPLLMTQPTRAIIPVLLEDFRKIVFEGRDHDPQFFSSADVVACVDRATSIELDTEMEPVPGVFVTAHYAGHVLGAAMFTVRVGARSVLYTGDFNVTPDRHLGSARVPRLCPDVLITEATYATTTRDSKRFREHEFLARVKAAVDRGGRVLIPVFALGRAQELCLLLDAYWTRVGLAGRVPIYVSAGLAMHANTFYKLFLAWTNETQRARFQSTAANPFNFATIAPLTRAAAAADGPMVVLATPGMLHAGMSLDLLTRWAGDPRNLVVIPGYCAPGTVGAKVLAGDTRITLPPPQATGAGTAAAVAAMAGAAGAPPAVMEVRLEVASLSFSAHADAHGIVSLLRQSSPRHVVLVHGERGKMALLRDRVWRELGIPCSCPGNGVTLSVGPPAADVRVRIAADVLAGWARDRETVGARYADEVAATVAARARRQAPLTAASADAATAVSGTEAAEESAEAADIDGAPSKRARPANSHHTQSHHSHGHGHGHGHSYGGHRGQGPAASALAQVEAALRAPAPTLAHTRARHTNISGDDDADEDENGSEGAFDDGDSGDTDVDGDGDDSGCGECGDCALCDSRFVPPPPEPVLEAVLLRTDAPPDFKPQHEVKPPPPPPQQPGKGSKAAAAATAACAARPQSAPLLAPGDAAWVVSPAHLALLGAAPVTVTLSRDLPLPQHWERLTADVTAAAAAAAESEAAAAAAAAVVVSTAAQAPGAEAGSRAVTTASARVPLGRLTSLLPALERARLMLVLLAHAVELALWCRLRAGPAAAAATATAAARSAEADVSGPVVYDSADAQARAAAASADTVDAWVAACGRALSPGAVAAAETGEVFIDGTSLRLKLLRRSAAVRLDWGVEDELIARQVEDVARRVMRRRVPALAVCALAGDAVWAGADAGNAAYTVAEASAMADAGDDAAAVV